MIWAPRSQSHHSGIESNQGSGQWSLPATRPNRTTVGLKVALYLRGMADTLRRPNRTTVGLKVVAIYALSEMQDSPNRTTVGLKDVQSGIIDIAGAQSQSHHSGIESRHVAMVSEPS